MAKYRKKPVVIEAVRFTTFDDLPALASFFGGVYDPTYERIVKGVDPSAVVNGRDGWLAIRADDKLHVNTLEGSITASMGDWIIKGVQGEFYPCKPDIFNATYELVLHQESAPINGVVYCLGCEAEWPCEQVGL